MNAPRREDLVGVWKTDPTDSKGIREMGFATLEFGHDGKLLYTVHGRDTDQVSVLTYKVEDGGWLVTDQPSAPKLERTRTTITDDGKLQLEFGGTPTRYIRAT